MWPEMLRERKREAFGTKGSKWEGGLHTVVQLLFLLNVFIHSVFYRAPFLCQTLRIPQGTNQKWHLPCGASIVLPLS